MHIDKSYIEIFFDRHSTKYMKSLQTAQFGCLPWQQNREKYYKKFSPQKLRRRYSFNFTDMISILFSMQILFFMSVSLTVWFVRQLKVAIDLVWEN